MYTKKELGQMIKSLRERQGITREELANKLGVALNTITYYEIGRNNFTIETYERIINALGHELNLTFTPQKSS